MASLMQKIILFFLLTIFMSSIGYAGFLVSRGEEDLPLGINLDNLCIDTDKNKKNPELKRGYVQDLNGIYWDECNADPTGPDLIERVCEKGFVKNQLIDCEKGCYLGACIKYSLFSLPKQAYLPTSQKILSIQRFTETTFKGDEEEAKYELNLFNLISLNDILSDINKRLNALESDKEIWPLIIRLTSVENMNERNINIDKVSYYLADYDEGLKIQNLEFIDPDMELYVDSSEYENILEIIDDKESLEEKLKNLYINDKLKTVAFSKKGENAKEKIKDILE